jgi:hypothetical protein
MFDCLTHDPYWFVGLGGVILLTALYILMMSSVTKDPNWMKQNEVDGDGGCGCGCTMAAGMFLLCYLWTAIFVSMVEYGRPWNGKPTHQEKKNEDRKRQGRVHGVLDQHTREYRC